jgi:hypothetical protein
MEGRVMKVTVELSVKHHEQLLRRSDCSSREYALLIYRCIVLRQRAERREPCVEIRCELEEANHLLEHANRVSPDAACEIAQSISGSREL